VLADDLIICVFFVYISGMIIGVLLEFIVAIAEFYVMARVEI